MKVFRKMDEMQEYISSKSLKIAYVYTLIFLGIWGITEYVKNKTIPDSLLFLLITQNIILVLSNAYFKIKMDIYQ